ncbi:MAG: glutamate-5-semialdehyde dehydrogenase [Gemmataceae bacterium]
MDTQAYSHDLADRAKKASRIMTSLLGGQKNSWLRRAADALEGQQTRIAEANATDIELAPQFELTPAQVDRLRLTPTRITAAANGLREIAQLPDPVGRVLESSIRPNGLEVQKVSVPLGVIFFIYESRPNVTIDAGGLCVKSGNAVILRGGKEALNSNLALHAILQECLTQDGLPADAVQLVNTPAREVVGELLKLDAKIDLVIPRGGEGLIRRVAAEATMPVLKHYHGNCHVYVDEAADLEIAKSIVLNAKCQRPGVCNAAESLLVHSAVAKDFLPGCAKELQAAGVRLKGCATARSFLGEMEAANEEDFRAEFLDLILSVKVVSSLDEAVGHIATYGSGHTDAIITNDWNTAREFTQRVDSAAVMVNASTRFNDGFELGLGAEIGISTDKFHARGPCGLVELCSYKYLVYGDGHIRH